MKNVKAVIGAGYGDECKGLIARYFAISQPNPLIIFYQGSNNRGATIDKKPDFKEQVLHFGAGTFDNVPTYFYGKFMFNPRDYWHERYLLRYYHNVTPIAYLDPKCRVITPVDEMIDRIRFVYRRQQGDNFSSTCLGTNSCNARTKYDAYNFTYEDFMKGDPISICKWLYTNWFPKALEEFGITYIPDKFKDDLSMEEGVIDGMLEKINMFKLTLDRIKDTLTLMTFDEAYNKYDTLIFESSAGLCLSSGYSNYCTASNTGIYDAVEAMKPYDDYEAEACYLTRPYITKHGIEPFPEETDDIYFYDYLNDYNVFQGYLRFGRLDYNKYCERCNNDFKVADNHWKLVKVLTHAHSMPIAQLDDFKYRSYTPYAEDVEVHDEK